MTLSDLKKNLRSEAKPDQAKILQRFFKTGPGEYGEGDKFLGIKVPILRKLSRAYKTLPHSDLQKLLNSKIHEERMIALFILRIQYEKGQEQEKCVNLYLKNTRFINNWDLVDTSAHYILGHWLLERDRKILYTFARSKNLWEKRIAILSCFAFIRKNDFQDALKIAEILLKDKHDLMHKAVGWMLREIGNRNRPTEEKFLQKHYKNMPRTMLRYAIEKFQEELRQAYLKGTL